MSSTPKQAQQVAKDIHAIMSDQCIYINHVFTQTKVVCIKAIKTGK